MTFVHIGNVSIQVEWIAVVLAIILFMFIERFVRQNSPLWFQDLMLNYILVWKLSYIIFQFPLFIQHPLSVLYFSGGWKGHALGIVIAIFLLIRKSKKNGEEQIWGNWLFSFVGYFLLYQASVYLLSELMWNGILLIIAYILIVYKSRHSKLNSWIFILILLNSAILAIEHLLFHVTGWTFILICLVLLCFMTIKDHLGVKNTLSWLTVVILVTSAIVNFQGNMQTDEMAKDEMELELQTLEGETIRLSDYKGKKVILNFWATWCPPCKAEMPHMQSFYDEHQEEVEVIAVNLTSRDNGKAALQSFIDSYELTFSIPLDEEGIYGNRYNIITIPTTYIIDSNGKLTQRVVGPMDQQMMEKVVNSVE
ncbi:redoxin domain-containing protein [Ureibacillus sp. NPDC094379]